MDLNEWANLVSKADRLKTPQAAKFLGVSIRTLEEWRKKRIGPRYLRLGHMIRYDADDLKAFVERGRQETAGISPPSV